MKRYLIPIFTFCLILFLKVHIIHLPDFVALFLLLLGLRHKLVRNLLTRPIFLGLYVVILISFGLLLFSVFPKPFWSYHILRVVIYLGAAYYLGLITQASDKKYVFWVSIWTSFAVAGTLIAVVYPQYFPSFLNELKIHAFWSNEGVIMSNNIGVVFRNAGIYTSYLEGGTVMAVSYLLALGQLKEKSKVSSVIYYVLISLACIMGIFFTAVRTSVVAILIGTVILTLGYLGSMRYKFLARNIIVLFMVYLLAVVILAGGFISLPSHVDIATRVVFLSAAWELLFGGKIDTSFSKTLDQFLLPESPLVWLFGNSGQPWMQGGVASDIGYVQVLWGVGLVGLVIIVAFYVWMLVKSINIYRQTGNGLSLSVIAVLIVYLILNVKGQFFIGIRSGDLAVVSFGFLLGTVDHRFSCQKAAQVGARGAENVRIWL